MTDTTPDRTVDDVLRDMLIIHAGRTRYHGQKLRDDELLVAEIQRLRAALQRLADCDWVITPGDRMDAVRKIARDALGGYLS